MTQVRAAATAFLLNLVYAFSGMALFGVLAIALFAYAAKGF